ncbi:MAG: methyl-accepting chemotaxis protein [Desulfobacterales bacterium]|nr:methyl-accepting chemotaxis protein [Desulfobacterales bacterium]
MSEDTYKDPREIFVTIACIAGVFITFITGLPSIFRGELVGKIIAFYGLVLVANLIYLQITKNIQVASLFLLITANIYFLFLLVKGGVSNTGPMWSFVVPPCTVFLAGLRKGTVLIVAYLFITVFFISMGFLNEGSLFEVRDFQLRFVLVYMFVAFASILNEFTREKNFSKLSIENKFRKESEEELAELNSQLENSRIMQSEISETIGQEVQVISNNLIAGSSKVAGASKQLAVGASKQASSLEEIAGSVTEISVLTKTNAKNSINANDLSERVIKAAKNGVQQMDTMVASITEINDASNEISQIIKTIDDIAFQTNLLALNAAVEAARAGKHGKGFAVVAQEVRILASRCTKAASRTSDLIDSSVGKIESGNKIAEKTSKVLDDINAKINDMGTLVDKITKASKKQVQGIELINNGLSDIEKVTVDNAGTAEEVSSSAENLSMHSNRIQSLLNSMIDRFNDLEEVQEDENEYELAEETSTIHPPKYTEEISPEDIISLDDDEFGRY